MQKERSCSKLLEEDDCIKGSECVTEEFNKKDCPQRYIQSHEWIFTWFELDVYKCNKCNKVDFTPTKKTTATASFL